MTKRRILFENIQTQGDLVHVCYVESYAQEHHLGLAARKHDFGGLRTTKAQISTSLWHSRSLVSAFAIILLESFISRLATSEISIF